MELEIMETNEGTSEDGDSIFGLGSFSVSKEEDMSASLMTTGGPLMTTFRGRSKVWSEFFVTQDGKKVTCRRCGDSLAYSNSHSTSSMLKHLKRKHHMDLYPPTEEESILSSRAPRPKQEKSKKGSKCKRGDAPPPVPEEQCIQHDPLEFSEPCIRMRWTDHSDTFLRNFVCMYDDEVYTDVTIVAEKQFFKGHRIILSSASEFFDETFKLTLPGQHPVVFLKDTKALELRMLLDFIYRGEVSIPPNLIPNLVKIGGDMRVRGLCDFVWNESMVSNPFQGYSNDSRVSVPRQPEIPSTHLSHTSTSHQNSIDGNSILPNRSLETLLRQQQTVFSAQGHGIISSGVTQASSSSASTMPRSVPTTGVKRMRILPSASVTNGNVTAGAASSELSNSGEEVQEQPMLMITSEGETILSTSQIDLIVSPDTRSSQFTTANTRIPIPIIENLRTHRSLQQSHSHSTDLQEDAEAISEVVFSITNVEVSGGQSEEEVLLSDTGDGEHTIVVYGDSEEDHNSTLCRTERKPFS